MSVPLCIVCFYGRGKWTWKTGMESANSGAMGLLVLWTVREGVIWDKRYTRGKPQGHWVLMNHSFQMWPSSVRRPKRTREQTRTDSSRGVEVQRIMLRIQSVEQPYIFIFRPNISELLVSICSFSSRCCRKIYKAVGVKLSSVKCAK